MRVVRRRRFPLGRAVFRICLGVIPMFVAAASPQLGIWLQIAPVLAGVLLCVRLAIRGALKDGWLAELC